MIPAHWVDAPLGEISTKIGSGATPKGGAAAYSEQGIPLIRSLNIHYDGFRHDGIAFLNDEQAEALRNVVVEAGDVLLNITGASIGRVATAPPEVAGARVNQHVSIIRPCSGVLSEFVRAFLAAPAMQRWINDENYGVTRQALTKEMIENISLPLPPLAEQRRIVEKIEALTARSRRAKEALAALPALLDRYRQSVLAAAFRGDVTADWRAAHPSTDASAFLRALSETRAVAVAGRSRPKPAAAIPADLDLPELPRSWVWASLDEALSGIVAGKSFRCDERPPEQDEIGLVKISAVTWGEFDEAESKTVRGGEVLDEKIRVKRGDFLLSRANTIELVGACVIVREVEKRLYLSDKVLRLDFVDDLVKRWALQWLRSPFGRFQLERSSSGNQMSMRNIAQDRLREVAMPLPPRDEMLKILERLERALNQAEAQKRTVEAAAPRLATLAQSILAKAFRGELVPQDPADEPASVLLGRIRAERAAAGAGTARRGRGWRSGSA
ncbi:restriction endonuclease subunit S [Caenispirillum bisanense]|uniref:restriction endonuclease subunit S n=1 Tax=Caenispirillum bisanense TaxID=414052 RepID=UPI0031D53AC8